MPSRLFPYAFLLLLGVAVSLASLRDPGYYQDLLSDPLSDEIRLNEFARLLETSAKNAEAYAAASRARHREHERREFERANKLKGAQEILKDDVRGVYSKRRSVHSFGHPAPQLDEISEEANLRREYVTRNPMNLYPLMNSILRGYPGYNGPYEIRPNPEHPTSGYRPHRQEVIEHGMKEEPSLDFGGQYHSLGRQHPDLQYSGGDAVEDRDESRPDFTYEIATTTHDRQELKFAVAPPNEQFYHDGPLNGFNSDDITDKGVTAKEKYTDPPPSTKFKIVPVTELPLANSVVVPEPKRRAEIHSPVVMAVAEHKFSNDIYFVAVVAGCSAAAMFILVLISLTWCRIQRGAKAAADVEYPAYGVTGPNKDTSPSGDRRLAQSAQMYHYQHQKQQIIAMESRTATGRDPGSVSEAESDEENEEGDYTVYECPGLAPTGEMEVKNPLFHDDPTPATPAGQSQNKRSSEDHM